MADTIREKIMKNILASLEAIKSINGYVNTVASVQRFKQSGQAVLDVPSILIAEGDEDAEYGPHPTMSKRLEVYLAVITRQDEESDSRSAAEVMNSLIGDVVRAMANDFTRGGNALDTIEQGSGPIEVEEGQPEIGILMRYEIMYRHGRTDPTSVT